MAEPSHTALLILDVRRGPVERTPGGAAAIDAALRAVSAGRVAGVPVVWATDSSGGWAAGEGDDQLDDRASPGPADILVSHRRVSAFAETELGSRLAGRQIDAVVLAGVTTSGVVLATAREAVDLGFRVAVLSDACADPDPLVQRILLERVLPPDVAVLSVDAWVGALNPTGAAGSSGAPAG